MELLEFQDPEKKKLIEASDRHRRELEKEVNAIAKKTERMLTNALIIGGSLAVTYFIVSRFSGSSGKHKGKVRTVRVKAAAAEEDHAAEEQAASPSFGIIAPALISQIGTQVINQATIMLLDIAREKLNEFLHSRKEKNENS